MQGICFLAFCVLLIPALTQDPAESCNTTLPSHIALYPGHACGRKEMAWCQLLAHARPFLHKIVAFACPFFDDMEIYRTYIYWFYQQFLVDAGIMSQRVVYGSFNS